MYLDKVGNPIFDNIDVFNFLYAGKIDQLSNLTVSSSSDISALEDTANIKFNKINDNSIEFNIEEYDKLVQSNWFMPEEYKNFDIEHWVLQHCTTNVEIIRIQEELDEFKQRDMMNLLRWLKYFVDTCRKNKILWGVGRGSSVASFVLYKIGIHKINSLVYDLDWREFLK